MNIISKRGNLPNHVAIIMDGNGRWAKAKGLKRRLGHQEGAKRIREIILTSKELNITYLTLFAFSTENWNRPKSEISGLMEILSAAVKKEIKDLSKLKVKIKIIGDITRFPKNIQNKLENIVKQTSEYNSLTVTLALGYGSKQELLNATKKIAHEVLNGKLKPGDLTENHLNHYLYDPDLPSVDLLIRTGGEYRISNFLLWQSAYAEFFFSKILWPEFYKEGFYEAIISYQKRERRFGAIHSE